MTKIDQNFTMWQGEDVVITAPVTNAGGTAVSLAGATAALWRVYETVTASTVSLSKTLGSGIALVDSAGTDDAVQITIATGDTDSLDPGKYYHECRVVDSSNKEQVIFVGSLILKRSRTN